MPRHTKVIDQGDAYLVSEELGPDGQPLIRVYAREDNRRTAAATTHASSSFSHEGARWTLLGTFADRCFSLADESCQSHLPFLRQIVLRYRWRRAEENDKAEHYCYFVEADGRPLHALHALQPGGLLLHLYREEADADRLAREHGARTGAECAVHRTGALREFLTLRAEEGYAGALLDDTEPIYWCVDRDENLQFLKLRPLEQENSVEGELLDTKGCWHALDEPVDLEPHEDQERWDELMEAALGTIPYVGYEREFRWHSLFADGHMVLVAEREDDRETGRLLPVFHDPEYAREFAEQHDMKEVEVAEVTDVRSLLRAAASEGAVALLQPDDHRARGGALWIDGERLVLDSFSGFWTSRDGKAFEPHVF